MVHPAGGFGSGGGHAGVAWARVSQGEGRGAQGTRSGKERIDGEEIDGLLAAGLGLADPKLPGSVIEVVELRATGQPDVAIPTSFDCGCPCIISLRGLAGLP